MRMIFPSMDVSMLVMLSSCFPGNKQQCQSLVTKKKWWWWCTGKWINKDLMKSCASVEILSCHSVPLQSTLTYIICQCNENKKGKSRLKLIITWIHHWPLCHHHAMGCGHTVLHKWSPQVTTCQLVVQTAKNSSLHHHQPITISPSPSTIISKLPIYKREEEEWQVKIHDATSWSPSTTPSHHSLYHLLVHTLWFQGWYKLGIQLLLRCQ